MISRTVFAGCAFCAACGVWVPAAAQDDALVDTGDRPELVDNLFACRDEEDATARLACFDRAIAVMQQAEADRDLIIADREQVREARRGLFGFSLPKIRLFGGSDKNGERIEEVKEIEEPLASFGSTAMGRASFTLQGGARWVQTDNVPVLGHPKPGDVVRIEQAALGSYKANIDGRRAIRVKRVD